MHGSSKRDWKRRRRRQQRRRRLPDNETMMRMTGGCRRNMCGWRWRIRAAHQKYRNSPFLPCLSFRIQSSEGDEGRECPGGTTASETIVCGTWATWPRLLRAFHHLRESSNTSSTSPLSSRRTHFASTDPFVVHSHSPDYRQFLVVVGRTRKENLDDFGVS